MQTYRMQANAVFSMNTLVGLLAGEWNMIILTIHNIVPCHDLLSFAIVMSQPPMIWILPLPCRHKGITSEMTIDL